MTKLLSYLAAFLLLVVYILSTLYIERGNKITVLETQKNALNGNKNDLEAEMEKRNEKALATDNHKKENNKQIDKDKTDFNLNYDLSVNPVLLNFKQLHNTN